MFLVDAPAERGIGDEGGQRWSEPATRRLKIPRFLPRAFLDEVGFTRTVRLAVQKPSDPELLRIFQQIAPRIDWTRYQPGAESYEPPRWIGYWAAQGVAWASDGVVKVILPNQDFPRTLFREVKDSCFATRPFAPFEGVNDREPGHMLLHDTEQWELHVEPFEHAEATLVNQSRTSGTR
ncbi:hypothetical protein DB347_17395 [Opitutaceae bacterium EW11]|nr:hypothetical protein DB347_17395 [Opitutaceae bacterium EW11]